MGLFNKKEEAPSIPTAATLPDLPKVERVAEKELPELPSFPGSSKNENINQEMVKSAIEDAPSNDDSKFMPPKPSTEDTPFMPPKEPEAKIESISSVPKPEEASFEPPKSQDLKPEFPSLPPKITTPVEPAKPKETPSIPSISSVSSSSHPSGMSILESHPSGQEHHDKHNEPIFVRIDKFQDSQKNLNQVKEKVKEIEVVIERLRAVKDQEEDELKGWSSDLDKIKTRLEKIDSDIFSQI